MSDREQYVVPSGTILGRRSLLDYTVIEEVVERDSYRLRNLDLNGATVLDCGAHIGIFSTMCAYEGAARVVAVEPQPENLELLHINCAPWPQIEIMGDAIASGGGMVAITGESGGSHLSDEGFVVSTVTLSYLINLCGRVDLLKLDMEGGEIDALLSTSHDHLARVQRIVMETHGPAICPWVKEPAVGKIVEHLLPTHNIESVAGFPTHLGMLFAQRNGCSYGW